MTLEGSIHSQRLRVLREAERLGNVSEACRRSGMSRTVFYRLRQRLEAYGSDGVHPKRRQARRGRPPAVPVQTERRVIALALAWPTCGPQWYSDQLAREGITIAPVTIWRLLRRRLLGTRRARLAVLEHGSATRGLLTERTAKPIRHVDADQPGDLLSLDTFYVGKLKGVGKVWQITGCDVASSFGWARLLVGEVTAAAVLGFLREVVRPTYRQAGWRLGRVLTDNGKEFKGAFAAGCERLGIRVTRTKPRHAWTNGFVGRLQKTILHEHWRIAFRRQYFTGVDRSKARSTAFSSSTTTSAHIAGIGCVGARRPPSSKARWPHDLVDKDVNTFAKLNTLGRIADRAGGFAPRALDRNVQLQNENLYSASESGDPRDGCRIRFGAGMA